MRYRCRAMIEYVVEVEAPDVEAAEMVVFEGLADDVVSGVIRVDRFDDGDGWPELVFVDVEAVRGGVE